MSFLSEERIKQLSRKADQIIKDLAKDEFTAEEGQFLSNILSRKLYEMGRCDPGRKLNEIAARENRRETEESEETENQKISSMPIVSQCFTQSFAYMIQLFRILTDNMDFSQPFRIEVEYDPEQPRTKQKLYLAKESLERCIEKGNLK